MYDTQYDFFTCEDNLTAFIAGIGSGKSFVGALKALSRMQPGTLGMVVAPTYGMLRDSSLRSFEELAGDGIVDFNKTEMTAVVRGGGEALFRSADDPNKLRGPNLQWVWIDEGGLSHRDTWKICIGRIRAGGEFGELWTTSTPKGKTNWLYKQSENMTVFKASTLDNPYVSEAWKQSLIDNYEGAFLQQEVYALFMGFEGLIYPMFDRGIHVAKRSLDEFDDMGLAIDEGYVNPAVILKIFHDRDGGYHIAQEWYETGKLHSEIAKQSLRMLEDGHRNAKVDSAAAGLIAELRDVGINAHPRKGRVVDGISTVQKMLKVRGDGKPRLTVDPGCVNTINEFDSYIWRDGKDEPVKEYDHAMDALRYYLSDKGRVRPLKAKQHKVGLRR